MALSVDRHNVIRGVCLCALAAVGASLPAARTFASPVWVTANPAPFIVAAAGFFEGPYAAGALGVFTGLLMSIGSSTVEGAESLMLGLFGVFCGTVGEAYMRRSMSSCLVLGVGFLILRGIVSAIYYRLFYSLPPIDIALGYLKVTAVSIPWGAAGYALTSLLRRKLPPEELK